MATMRQLELLPMAVRARVMSCAQCEADGAPRAFVCDYHEGWWDGWEARATWGGEAS